MKTFATEQGIFTIFSPLLTPSKSLVRELYRVAVLASSLAFDLSSPEFVQEQ